MLKDDVPEESAGWNWEGFFGMMESYQSYAQFESQSAYSYLFNNEEKKIAAQGFYNVKKDGFTHLFRNKIAGAYLMYGKCIDNNRNQGANIGSTQALHWAIGVRESETWYYGIKYIDKNSGNEIYSYAGVSGLWGDKFSYSIIIKAFDL